MLLVIVFIHSGSQGHGGVVEDFTFKFLHLVIQETSYEDDWAKDLKKDWSAMIYSGTHFVATPASPMALHAHMVFQRRLVRCPSSAPPESEEAFGVSDAF